MPKQYPLKIETTFIETKPAGLAAKYLNSGEIQLRAGVEIAIACLFAPLGAALSGASRKDIEQLIAISRTQSETYFALALNRCQDFSSRETVVGTPVNPNDAPINRDWKEDVFLPLGGRSTDDFDFEENLNFDDEEF
ncbi:hypothetical protein [Chroococcus sp. FPU101]|uniref:hypothetical protein n=1 Tax=Chroococcus sp. FPU101 TaxID=1974212 RepID=UPI001A8E7550|nr:hypothetical protein [Chroococcus sp. FPU101]GFE72212.1 hypothetical protein CFPU101_48220 [Chroococcus sp. FPU101]